MQALVRRVEARVRRAMAEQDQAHDWYHIERVRTMALRIAHAEGGNLLIIELAALVHDIGDRKVHESEEAGYRATRVLLQKCGVPASLAEPVVDIAHQVSFKGFGVPDDMPTLEGKIVQDADRLDAIGAIAIARAFTWGGSKGRPMHDPAEPIFHAHNADDYYTKGGRTTINHFHEKLLHLKDRMHTATARTIAEERHAFMLGFLAKFEQEWHGQC
jgi:uncharacterized protein